MGVQPLSVWSKYKCLWATAYNQISLCSWWDSSSRCPSGWETCPESPWWRCWWAACSTHNPPSLDTREAALGGKDGWIATGRREEAEEGSCDGAGTVGTERGDWVNAAAAGGGRFDELKANKASDCARLADGTDAGFEHGAATDDDSQTGEAGDGLASEESYLVIEAPAGMLMMAELADDLEAPAQCDSS